MSKYLCETDRWLQVDFDSVFNQSRHTYSFGSPDILPIFSHGAPLDKIDTWMYDEEDEDFTKGVEHMHVPCTLSMLIRIEDAKELDLWVLDRLRDLFHNASGDGDLEKQLKEEQTVFFLHLLGLDTTGHSYRPHSKVGRFLNTILLVVLTRFQEYMENIQIVDSIVERTEELFNEFFQDDKTAYVFTADHGMSNIGNHGDGSKCTKSP